MVEQSLKARINDAMKLAMKARDKQRLATFRLIQAEFKRIEVDERIEVDNSRVLVVLDKMCKQRRDSRQQYQDAGRTELAEQEAYEIGVIQEFLPEQVGLEELNQMISDAITQSDAQSMKDMGKVMGILKPKLQGRADMAQVSKLIKTKLT